MNTLEKNDHYLLFFEQYIADSRVNFKNLKKEFQLTKHKNPNFTFELFLTQHMLENYDNFMTSLSNKICTNCTEEVLNIVIKKIIAYIKLLLEKTTFIQENNSASIILKIILMKINNFSLKYQSKDTNKNHISELDTIHFLLNDNNLHLNITESQIRTEAKGQNTQNFYSNFIADRKSSYKNILQKIKDDINHFAQTRTDNDFKTFIDLNYKLICKINHPEILTKKTPEKITTSRETEIALRKEVQKIIIQPLLQDLENKYKPLLNSKKTKQEQAKIKVNITRTEFTLFFLLLKEKGIFHNIDNDTKLANFIERTFVDKNNKSFNNIKVLISQIKNNEKNVTSSINDILMFIEEYQKTLNQ